MARTTVLTIPRPPLGLRDRIRVGRNFSLLAALIVLAVAYGELIPFRFSAVQSAPAATGVFAQLDWGENSGADILVNVLLFVPVGLLMTLHFVAGSRRWGPAILAGSLFAAILGGGLECLQIYLPVRVASGTDMFNNALGGLSGALLAPSFYRTWHRARKQLGHYLILFPHQVAWWVLVFILCLTALAPFDFSLSPARLAQSFKQAQWWPLLGTAPSFLATQEINAWTAILDVIRHAGMFAALAYVGACGLRERGESRLVSTLVTLRRTTTLVLCLEAAQFLTASHVFELLDVLAGCVGAVAGVWLAALIGGLSRSDDQLAPAKRYRIAVGLAVAAWATVEVLASLHSTLLSQGSPVDSIVWLPFVSEFYRPAHLAFAALGGLFLKYAAFSCLILLLLRRSAGVILRGSVVLLVFAWAILMEFVRSVGGGGTVGTSGPLLAAAAAMLSVAGFAWAARVADHARRRLCSASVTAKSAADTRYPAPNLPADAPA